MEREVLIKAMVMSIPTYTMSYFKISNTFYDEEEKMMTRFWWGQKKKERKIYQVSWKQMCKPKQEGGMGFKDLKTLNMVLLAKQSLRVMSDTNSLLHKYVESQIFL